MTTATNALEYGAAIHQHKPNAIVVDVDRSGVDPAQLVRFVRTFDAAEPIHLIATGKELSYGRGEALMQCGFDAYLGKPFELAALIAYQNMSSKFNSALGVPAHGFCVQRRPT